ncbi:hypothetical protein, partial [Moraxella catarrhalis]|uniref:hypothetical protein n=1 Tax=Moraxella catarrhalis TaxID=480 RepID=UPI000EE609C3
KRLKNWFTFKKNVFKIHVKDMALYMYLTCILSAFSRHFNLSVLFIFIDGIEENYRQPFYKENPYV